MTQPIGIFDSGIGGVSIWKEIQALLPHEHTIYLADNQHAPYGRKSKEEILALSIKNTAFLLDKKCKLVVVACNTATTNAIKYLRKNYDIPFIGIEPAIKPAALKTRTGTIGILATRGTLNSALFAKTSQEIAKDITIIEQVGEGLVSLIEEGKLYSKEMSVLLKKHLRPFQKDKIDYLVLGCTHYPYLIPQIQTRLGEKVHIVNPGKAVVKQMQNILTKKQLINSSSVPASHEFYANKEVDSLKMLLEGYANTRIEKLDF